MPLYLSIFVTIYLAMVAMAFWEAYAEGRNSWGKNKLGWKIALPGGFTLTAYHFWLFFIMWPLVLFVPVIISGFDVKIVGVLISAYFSGIIIEDIFWYVVNPVVKFRELFSDFSDYYPWIRIGSRKIIPVGYIINLIIAFLSWYFLWR